MTNTTKANGVQEIMHTVFHEGHVLYPDHAPGSLHNRFGFEPSGAPGTNCFQKLQGGGARENQFSNEKFFNPRKPVKTVLIDGIELSAGDRVCIRPSCPMDALDLILTGKTAVIDALEQDVEGHVHLGLALAGDSEGYLDAVRQSGYRLFYPADEVEPCKREVES